MNYTTLATESFPYAPAPGTFTLESFSRPAGIAVKQLPDVMPWTRMFYTQFELDFDPQPYYYAMKDNNYIIPTVAIVGYLLFCYYGQIIMKNRKPFGLLSELQLWNLFLATFSAYGVVRTVPHLFYRMYAEDFEDTICTQAPEGYGLGACGLASILFILSKLPELVDTVFIVLRKKPLIFLHWYHHVTVLMFCWHSYVTLSSAGLYFIAMNYTVHSVMYFYFFLMARKAIPKWFPSWIITLMQISQMVVGTFIVGASLYINYYGSAKWAPGACNIEPSNLAVGGVIYSSYLYLFAEFFVKRFLLGMKDYDPRGDRTKVKKVD